jgi:hypothetical protein
MKNKTGKVSPWLVVAIIAVGVFLIFPNILSGIFTPSTPVTPAPGNAPFNPTASWSTVDKFTSGAVTGTAYWQVGANRASTSNASNVNPGTAYKYWMSNSTYFVKPLEVTGAAGNNVYVNSEAYANGTIALTAYDTSGKAAIGVTTHNATLGANGVVNVEFDYQPVYGASNLPFGGLFVIEMNNTITSVSCTGDGISTNSGKYHLTYATSNLSAKYQAFEIASGYDSGSGGALKAINCQFTNGGSSAAYSQYIAKVIPANYYIANDGNIYLDVEKFMNNGASTRTGIGTNTAFTGYFS